MSGAKPQEINKGGVLKVSLSEIRELDPVEKLHRLTEIIEQGASAVIIIHDRNGASSFVFNSTGYEARRAVADTAIAFEELFREQTRMQCKEALKNDK